MGYARKSEASKLVGSYVLGFSGRMVWRCSSRYISSMMNTFTSILFYILLKSTTDINFSNCGRCGDPPGRRDFDLNAVYGHPIVTGTYNAGQVRSILDQYSPQLWVLVICELFQLSILFHIMLWI